MPARPKTIEKPRATSKPSPTPRWKPAPPALVARFETLVRPLAGVTVRKMFGYPAAFASEHMCIALFQDHMILRLPAEQRAELLEQPGARMFEPMPGRPMREYVVVPAAIVQDDGRIKSWMRKAAAYAASLPPKPARGAKARRA